MLSLLLIVGSLLGSSPSVESSFFIKGVVIDKETNEPVPFAHVKMGDVINISNVEGEFVISGSGIDKASASLKVSYIGYEDYEKPLSEISSYHEIFLEPSLTVLDEVVVKTGSSIMNQVFSRFHVNYEMGRQHMVGYYMETMSNHEEPNYVAEGIMDIYTPSNTDKYAAPLVKPIKTRKKVFKEVDEINEVLGGNASDMAHSSIWREGSFLTPKNRKNYEYFYTGATNAGQHRVYIIEFEPKNAKGDTKGVIYVEEESLAIVKIEYTPIIHNWKFWESVAWTEEYDLKNGIFEMVSVTYEGTSTNHEFNYKAHLIINESDKIDSLPREMEMLSEYDFFFHEATEDFTDAFWVGFNFMKLDHSMEKLVNSF